MFNNNIFISKSYEIELLYPLNSNGLLYVGDFIHLNVRMNESNLLDGLYINNFNMSY